MRYHLKSKIYYGCPKVKEKKDECIIAQNNSHSMKFLERYGSKDITLFKKGIFDNLL